MPIERDISQAADCSSKQKCGRRQAMNPLIQIAIQILKFQQTPSGLALPLFLSHAFLLMHGYHMSRRMDGLWLINHILFVLVPKTKKKAKKAEKRKTAAVRNSAINMQIKWGIKNAVNVIFSIISFVSVYLYILSLFFGYKLENIKLHIRLNEYRE